MKTIGMIGGLSWQSTQTYYQIINEEANKLLGNNHSARILMYSFDFDEIEKLQYTSKWKELCLLMNKAGQKLIDAGADMLIICSNTMHECVNQMSFSIPLLHISDAIGESLQSLNIKNAGLLGTRFLMKSKTYASRITDNYNVAIQLPGEKQIETINSIIYNDLVKGIIKEESRKTVLNIIQSMEKKGIEAIILGCTEIPLLIKKDDCRIPVFDSTRIHALKAVKFALEEVQ